MFDVKVTNKHYSTLLQYMSVYLDHLLYICVSKYYIVGLSVCVLHIHRCK